MTIAYSLTLTTERCVASAVLRIIFIDVSMTLSVCEDSFLVGEKFEMQTLIKRSKKIRHLIINLTHDFHGKNDRKKTK